MEDVEVLEGDEARMYQEYLLEGVQDELGATGKGDRVTEFLAGSRDFGRGDQSASAFVATLVDLFGHDKAMKLIPNLAKLIRHDDRRIDLLREARGGNAVEESKSIPFTEESKEVVSGVPVESKVPVETGVVQGRVVVPPPETLWQDQAPEVIAAPPSKEPPSSALWDEPEPAPHSDDVPQPEDTTPVDEPPPQAPEPEAPVAPEEPEEEEPQEEQMKPEEEEPEEEQKKPEEEDDQKEEPDTAGVEENEEDGRHEMTEATPPPATEEPSKSEEEPPKPAEEPAKPEEELKEEFKEEPKVVVEVPKPKEEVPKPKQEEPKEVEEPKPKEDEEPPPAPPRKVKGKVVVIADFLNSEPWQLAVAEGDVVEATKSHDDGWTDVIGTDGGRGMVPTTYLEEVPPDPDDVKVATGPEMVELQRSAMTKARARLDSLGRASRLSEFAGATRSYAGGDLNAVEFRQLLADLLGDPDLAATTCLDLAPLVQDDAKRKALVKEARHPTVIAAKEENGGLLLDEPLFAPTPSPASKKAEPASTPMNPPSRGADETPSTVSVSNTTSKKLWENDPDTEEEDWIEKLRRERLAAQQKKKQQPAYEPPPPPSSRAPQPQKSSRNPFEAASMGNSEDLFGRQPYSSSSGGGYLYSDEPTPPPTDPLAGPAHFDEREIIMARSHGVGAYSPEMMERLQRLREDEELAARLQREEEEAARGGGSSNSLPNRPVPQPTAPRVPPPRRPAVGTHLHSFPERIEGDDDNNQGVPPPKETMWDSVFGGDDDRRDVPAPRTFSARDDVRSAAENATSGAGVWNSIFGTDNDDPLSSLATRSQQEIEDEALARALQAEEEANAGRSAPAPPPPPPVDPPSRTYANPYSSGEDPLSAPDDIALFRCGACGETMHVKNAVQGAQFQCPLCGRLNTYVILLLVAFFPSQDLITFHQQLHHLDLFDPYWTTPRPITRRRIHPFTYFKEPTVIIAVRTHILPYVRLSFFLYSSQANDVTTNLPVDQRGGIGSCSHFSSHLYSVQPAPPYRSSFHHPFLYCTSNSSARSLIADDESPGGWCHLSWDPRRSSRCGSGRHQGRPSSLDTCPGRRGG